MVEPPTSRRAEALVLSDELLADIELARLSPPQIARKAYRLARLLDDEDAMGWLHFEVNGYTLLQPENVFEPGGWEAAHRSNRGIISADGTETASATSLGQLQADIEGGRIQLAAASDPAVSLHSSNQYQHVQAPAENAQERSLLRSRMSGQQATLDKVVGAIHTYVVDRHQELRFGSAVETAFEVVRAEVDARIGSLVPDAPGMLAAAFENAASRNPELWANAASICRRLLKAAADALRPPSEPVNGRPMTDSHYINRLVDWIVEQTSSATTREFVQGDLEFLGRRLDAVDTAGQKGAHATVERYDAARFLTGTYLALGDVLRLAPEVRANTLQGTAPSGDLAEAEQSGAEPGSAYEA